MIFIFYLLTPYRSTPNFKFKKQLPLQKHTLQKRRRLLWTARAPALLPLLQKPAFYTELFFGPSLTYIPTKMLSFDIYIHHVSQKRVDFTRANIKNLTHQLIMKSTQILQAMIMYCYQPASSHHWIQCVNPNLGDNIYIPPHTPLLDNNIHHASQKRVDFTGANIKNVKYAYDHLTHELIMISTQILQAMIMYCYQPASSSHASQKRVDFTRATINLTHQLIMKSTQILQAMIMYCYQQASHQLARETNEVAIYEELYASRHGNRADNIAI